MAITLLDIARLNGATDVVGLIEENLTFAPEWERIPARTIKGTSYPIVLRSGYPGVSFRTANDGVAAGSSTYERKLAECFIIDAQLRVDKAVADADERGASRVLALEASGATRQAMIEVGSQVFYGTSVDSKGFPGLTEIHTALGTSLVKDAGGTTATTGSSVWGVKLGDEGIQFVVGNGGSIQMGEWITQQVSGATASTYYTAYTNGLTAWIGLQVGSKYSLGRLKDATADSGKGVTDALLAELLSKYPVGYKPDVWFMSRRSAFQLQSSRSATVSAINAKSSSGQEVFAPMPTESQGIPIVVTDSLTDTETLS